MVFISFSLRHAEPIDIYWSALSYTVDLVSWELSAYHVLGGFTYRDSFSSWVVDIIILNLQMRKSVEVE